MSCGLSMSQSQCDGTVLTMRLTQACRVPEDVGGNTGSFIHLPAKGILTSRQSTSTILCSAMHTTVSTLPKQFGVAGLIGCRTPAQSCSDSTISVLARDEFGSVRTGTAHTIGAILKYTYHVKDSVSDMMNEREKYFHSGLIRAHI